MESLWKLTCLLEPGSLAFIGTAILVTFVSASRALDHGKEMQKNLNFSEASITLDRSQAVMIPLASSCSLLLMFYLFSSVSQLITAFVAVGTASALYFCLIPYVAYVKSRFGVVDPFILRCCSKSLTPSQGMFLLFSIGIVAAWLVTGHWLLSNLLGICICVAFVSHGRLPNIKICSLLLVCLFLYDIFWVFLLERFLGANVMVSVATQKASNPLHKVATSLSLPGLQLITKKLELPVKVVFPRKLFPGLVPGSSSTDYIMLVLGDMAVPGMLLALALCFNHRKSRDMACMSELSSSKQHKHIRYAVFGYVVGLITALAAGVLTQSPQPALLYLIPSTLGPLVFHSWARNELSELWNGGSPAPSEKAGTVDV